MRVRACVFVYVCDFYLILFFELSFATTSRCWRLLHAVYCMTLFNYSGKKAIDEGFTFRWHLSNIMPDSIFYGSIFQGITCLFVCLFRLFVCWFVCCFFLHGVATTVFPKWEEMNTVFCKYITSGHEKTLSYSGLRQVGLINFGWGPNFRTGLWIQESGFYLKVV